MAENKEEIKKKLKEQLIRLVDEGKIIRQHCYGKFGFSIHCFKGHHYFNFMETKDFLIGNQDIILFDK